MDIDKLLYDIGFTTTHLSISNESLKLLNELKTDKSSYISSIPNEIYQIIIKYLYIEYSYYLNENQIEHELNMVYDHIRINYVLINNKYIGIIKGFDENYDKMSEFVDLHRFFNKLNAKTIKIGSSKYKKIYKLIYLNEITPSTELGKIMNKKIKYILNIENKIE